MGKKINVIEINGKRYDAHTGATLDHGHKNHHHENQPGAVIEPKPIAVQHAAPAEPKPTKPTLASPSPHQRSTHKKAKSVTHHKQQRSATLMRQAVKRPSPSLKRRLKVQSHTGALIEQPAIEIEPKLSFSAANNKRFEHASRIKKSSLIMHFNLNAQPTTDNQVKVTINRPAVAPKPRLPKDVPRQSAPDLDDIFERAIQHATSHLEPAPKTRKKHRLGLRRKHARA